MKWLRRVIVVGGAVALSSSALVPSATAQSARAQSTMPGMPGALAIGAPALPAGSAFSSGTPLGDMTPRSGAQGEGRLSMTFSDVAVATLIEMIARQGDVQVLINGDVQGKLAFVNLRDVTPEQAIQMVAGQANLQWRKVGPDTYVVAKELPAAPPAGAPIAGPAVVPWDGGSAYQMIAPPTIDPNALPELVNPNVDADGNAPRGIHYLKIKNVRPSIIAYWMDPLNQPKPLEFVTSDNNAAAYNRQYLGGPAFAPSAEAQNGLGGQSYNPYAPNNGNFMGGYGQFATPYTQGNAQFGGGGNNQGGGRGGRGGQNGQNGGGRGGRGGQNGQNGGGGGGGGGVFELPEGVDSITSVDPQNALLVFSTQQGFDRLQDIVNLLDQPLRQVEIEAQFVTINTADTQAFGIDFTSANGPFTVNAFGFQPGAPDGAGSFQLGFVRGNFAATLRALVSLNRAKVVTAPRVTAINNLTASLSSSTQTPVVTTTSTVVGGNNVGVQNAQQVNYIRTNIGLTVTPTINNDDTITVLMRPEVESATPFGAGIAPQINSQRVETVANVRDGDTIVLGGLRAKTLSNINQRIPLLSRIPLIGFLFQRREQSVSDQDLIIFLTARILRRFQGDEQAVPGT